MLEKEAEKCGLLRVYGLDLPMLEEVCLVVGVVGREVAVVVLEGGVVACGLEGFEGLVYVVALIEPCHFALTWNESVVGQDLDSEG